MKLLFKILFCLFLFSSYELKAQSCDYSINIDSYFPVTVSPTAQTLPYSLDLMRGQNSSNQNCRNYRLYFAKGNANSYQRRAYSGSDSLPYNLYREINNANILKDFGDASANEFITGLAQNKLTPYTSTWYVGVPSLFDNFTSARAGVYTDSLPVNIYQVKNNGDVVFQTARWVTLSFTIPRYVEMSIVDQNQPHNSSSTVYVMDFGNMTNSQQLQADLRVVGNVGFGVSLTSQNGGKLKIAGDPTSTEIPYTIRVGNGGFFSPSNPNSPYFLFDTNNPTNLSGNQYSIRVKLGNIPNNSKDGDYAEVITLTVQAY